MKKLTKNSLRKIIKKTIEESSKPTYLESWGSKKTTVKEIAKWMKTLEENRYKKTYNSDARRVAWLVNNNLSEDYESMPISMRKKWSKAAYGKERYLAKEFIKSKMNEEKLKESIRKIVKNLLGEGKLTEATSEISISLDDFDKVKKLIKPKSKQLVKHPFSKKTFGLKVNKNQYDKVLELLIKKRINVQG